MLLCVSVTLVSYESGRKREREPGVGRDGRCGGGLFIKEFGINSESSLKKPSRQNRKVCFVSEGLFFFGGSERSFMSTVITLS